MSAAFKVVWEVLPEAVEATEAVLDTPEAETASLEVVAVERVTN